MSESEDERRWLTSTDIKLLLLLAAQHVGARKLGLFFVACAEAILRNRPAADRCTALLPAVRASIDGEHPADELRVRLQAEEREAVTQLFRLVDETGRRGRLRHAVQDYSDTAIALGLQADALGGHETWPWWETTTDVDPLEFPRFQAYEMRRERIVADHLPHLRDIAGNPFRSVAFAPEWRTEAVVALARAMYESRDFAPMPVLADALDDAGCDQSDLLAHCRGPGPHVRGCWVVDLVLGKA